ncbi:hypothetical protein CEXT_751501 [Caerostris extrusa]|uniref:BZIP domain-containing protein n=1 Tax=Caerostris extrusa TaxID=172846 RepID=A0AAV4Y7U6_CAEEX|nr:hypothetical protein CEXT_751501 [Caerostris extrusa]
MERTMPGNDSSVESALSNKRNGEGCFFKNERRESIGTVKEEHTPIDLSLKFQHVNDNRSIAAPEISRNSRSSHGHPFPPVLNPTIQDRSNSSHTIESPFAVKNLLNNQHSSNKPVSTESSFKKAPFHFYPYYAQYPVLPVKERSHFTPVNSPCDENQVKPKEEKKYDEDSYKRTWFQNFMEPNMHVQNYFSIRNGPLFNLPTCSSNEITGNENKHRKVNGSFDQPNPTLLIADSTGWPKEPMLRQNFANYQSLSMNGSLRDGSRRENRKEMSPIYLDEQSMGLNDEASNSGGESGKEGSINSQYEIMTSPKTGSNDLPEAFVKLSSPISQQSINGQVGRKRSAPFPDDKKDKKYYERREKNNLAAKKSRQKRRDNERRLKQENSRLRRVNIELQCRLKATQDQVTQEQKKNEIFTQMRVGNLVLYHDGMPGMDRTTNL